VRETDHLGEPSIDGRIILRWIFRKWDVGIGTGSCWLRIRTGGGHCECGFETSDLKFWVFLDYCKPVSE
jgi:hypothetical protein